MPGGNIFAVYLAAVLAVVVIVTALGAAIVVYQREGKYFMADADGDDRDRNDHDHGHGRGRDKGND